MIRRQEYDMESGTGRSFLMANYTLVANEHGRLLTTKAAWTAFAEHVASLIDCSVRWD